MDKMRIFVSWSGARSAAVAEALKEYLPVINNAFDPWLSSVDIEKGSRSTSEIAEALAAARAGIICLTPNNLKEPWILYEAGGVAKTVDKPLACTLLIDLEPSEVSKPLGDFQHTRLVEKELLQLVKTLNRALGEGAKREEAQLEKSFKLCWPELKAKLDELPKDGPTARHPRPVNEVLEELVATVRNTSQRDTALLELVSDQILNFSAKITDLDAAYLRPYRGLTGIVSIPTNSIRSNVNFTELSIPNAESPAVSAGLKLQPNPPESGTAPTVSTLRKIGHAGGRSQTQNKKDEK
jgi:hypothetical protein